MAEWDDDRVLLDGVTGTIQQLVDYAEPIKVKRKPVGFLWLDKATRRRLREGRTPGKGGHPHGAD